MVEPRDVRLFVRLEGAIKATGSKSPSSKAISVLFERLLSLSKSVNSTRNVCRLHR